MKNSAGVLLLILAGLAPGALVAEPPASEQNPQVAGFDDMKAARSALDELIRAYESGDIGLIQSRLDPAMIGYQRFIDGMRRDAATLKQPRLHLFDANVTAGPDVTMIQAAWEKRFFGVADFTPGLFTGRSTFLMHRTKTGWRLAAVAGDNPFASEAGVLATLTVMPATLPLLSLDPCGGGPGQAPVIIDLVDPDLAGLQSVTIEAVTNQGDREGVVLTAISPGRFRRASLPICRESMPPPRGSGSVEINPAAGTGVLTFRYIDANPGANRPSATLMRTLTIR